MKPSSEYRLPFEAPIYELEARLAEMEALSGARPIMILAPARAAAILRAPMSADAAAVA